MWLGHLSGRMAFPGTRSGLHELERSSLEYQKDVLGFDDSLSGDRVWKKLWRHGICQATHQ